MSMKGMINRGIKGIRQFHSIYHVNPTIIELNKIENQILNKAYEEYVPKHGFNKKSIDLASKEFDINGGGIFNFTSNSKDAKMELCLFHLKKCRDELNKLAQSKEFNEIMNNSKEIDRLRSLIKYRLSLNKKIINELPGLLGYVLINKDRLIESMKELHELSDDLTYYSGDKSNDFAWYSKRISVSGLIIQSELFMINDKSKGFEDTFKFVDSKLKEIETAGYIYKSIEEWIFFNAVSIVNLLKSQLSRG